MPRHLKASIRGGKSGTVILANLTRTHSAASYFPEIAGRRKKIIFWWKRAESVVFTMPRKKQIATRIFPIFLQENTRLLQVCVCPFLFGCCLLCDCLEWCLKDPFSLLGSPLRIDGGVRFVFGMDIWELLTVLHIGTSFTNNKIKKT